MTEIENLFLLHLSVLSPVQQNASYKHCLETFFDISNKFRLIPTIFYILNFYS